MVSGADDQRAEVGDEPLLPAERLLVKLRCVELPVDLVQIPETEGFKFRVRLQYFHFPSQRQFV